MTYMYSVFRFSGFQFLNRVPSCPVVPVTNSSAMTVRALISGRDVTGGRTAQTVLMNRTAVSCFSVASWLIFDNAVNVSSVGNPIVDSATRG